MRKTLLVTAAALVLPAGSYAFAGEHADHAVEKAEDASQDAAKTAEKSWEEARETADDAWDETKEAADDAWDNTREAAADASEETREATADVKKETREAKADAKKAAKDAKREARNIEDMSDDERSSLYQRVSTASGPILMEGEHAILTSQAVTARNLDNIAVTSSNGKKIATVRDIVIGPDGKARKLVVGEGGVLGVGEKPVAIDIEKATFTPQLKDHPRVSVVTTEASLEAAQRYNENRLGVNEMTASELIGQEVRLTGAQDADETAAIYDLVMTPAGQTEYVVFAHGDILGVGGKKFVAPFSDLQIAEGDGGYTLAMSPERISYVETFVYDYEDVKGEVRTNVDAEAKTRMGDDEDRNDQ